MTRAQKKVQKPVLTLPRRWIAMVLAVAVGAGAAVVIVVVRHHDEACPADSLVAAHSLLLNPAGMVQQPDTRLDRLGAAVAAMGPPFGAVRAGVGFDYDQYIHLYGVAGGVLAWTKNNAPVTLLDEATLKPRWALLPSEKRTAWDASAHRFLLLDLAATKPTTVSSYDLTDGHRVWCTSLAAHQKDGSPVSTAFLDDGSVLVALPGRGGIDLTRLSARGRELWHRNVTGIDRADYLGPLATDVFVAGGTDEFRLAQPDPSAPAGPVVRAASTVDGRPTWSWDAMKGELAHVVGVSGSSTILVTRSTDAIRLRALDLTGAELWETPPADSAYESTLRGDVVIMRSRAGIDGYAVATGKQLWHQAFPPGVTYFPYGFTLDQMPSLDADHVLMPTTTALQILDVHTGAEVAYPLPTDGVSTTYWPYQLLVTPGLLGVVTNTGAILAERD